MAAIAVVRVSIALLTFFSPSPTVTEPFRGGAISSLQSTSRGQSFDPDRPWMARRPANTKLFHAKTQRVGIDAEHFRGIARAVDAPPAPLQRILDMPPLDRFER